MTLLVPLKSRASIWRSEEWRQFLQLCREESSQCSSSVVQTVLGAFQCPIAALLSFEHIWDKDDHTSGQVVSGLDLTWELVNLPPVHE